MTEIGKSLIEEGKREGKREGKEEGKKEKAKEIARELLDILSIEMIAKKTGLTIEEVKKLQEDIEK